MLTSWMTRNSFRPHRGGYAEAAAERVEFVSPDDLPDILESRFEFHGPFTSKLYFEDLRMKPSERYMILDVTGCPVGYSSCPVPPVRETTHVVDDH
jgi:hypothetical protein